MTIRDYFDRAVRFRPDAPFMRFSGRGSAAWQTLSYAQTAARVQAAFAALAPLGLEPRRDIAAFMLPNSPEWIVLYLALSGAGVAVSPFDPKLRAVEARHILSDSGASALFAQTAQAGTVAEAAKGLKSLRTIVWTDAADDASAPSVPGFACRALASLQGSCCTPPAKAAAAYAAARPSEDDMASLIYSSGTTGSPKGVMLSHGNFSANVTATLARVGFSASDSFMNVLPLFHAFSFTGNFLLPLCVGASVTFARSIRTLAEDLVQTSPTILLAVPLLAEKLYARIDAQIKKSLVASGLFKFGFSRKIVARKIVERFGGKLRLLGIGGAPTSVETLEGFKKIGLFVLEGYGITECCPGVAYPCPESFVPGTVGPVLDSYEWKLANVDGTGAGELLLKGPSVMKGYWRNEEQTKAAFDEDGFYRTGDIVRIDKSGNVAICGRCKSLIVNREGKNIYPEEVERPIEHSPLIKDILVLGWRAKGETGEHVGAIAVPDADAVAAHLKRDSLSREELVAFTSSYILGVCRASVADYKIPRKIEVRLEPLERTPSLKIKRALYAGALDE